MLIYCTHDHSDNNTNSNILPTTTMAIITISSDVQFYKIHRSDECIRRPLICKVTFLENEASHAAKLFNHFDPFWIIASPATLSVPRITSYIYIYALLDMQSGMPRIGDTIYLNRRESLFARTDDWRNWDFESLFRSWKACFNGSSMTAMD